MPSTVGLCLYLQTVNVGSLITPRISDESWPLLWNHLSEVDSSRLSAGPPIAGRIEFDIDQRKARWLDAWLGINRKVSVDLNHGLRPSWHGREDSKTLDFAIPPIEPEHESLLEDSIWASQRNELQPRGHLRRLSLLRGSESSQVSSHAMAPVKGLPTIVSPTPQADPAPELKQELAARVQTWREESLVTSHETPQKSDGGAVSAPHLITSSHATVVDHSSQVHGDPETSPAGLDLDDFQWSISSFGPGSIISSSSISPYTLLDGQRVDRYAGSVCLTPTTATSFGPDYSDVADYEAFTDLRPASPDIASRVIEDVPCTPTTVTSFGPTSWIDEEFECDDLLESQSVDIGFRCAGSLPQSPVEQNFTFCLDAWKQTPWGLIWPMETHTSQSTLDLFSWPYNPSRGSLRSATNWPYNAARGHLYGPRGDQPSSDLMFGLQNSFKRENDAQSSDLECPVSLGDSLTSYTFSSQHDAWKISPWGLIWPFNVPSAESELKSELSMWPYNSLRGTAVASGVAHRLFDVGRTVGQEQFPVVQSTFHNAFDRFFGNQQNLAVTKKGGVIYSREDAWKLNPWGMIWPFTSVTQQVSPIEPIRSHTESFPKAYLEPAVLGQLASAWRSVWPYYNSPKEIHNNSSGVLYPKFDLCEW